MKIDEKRKVKVVIAKIAHSRRMLHSCPLGKKTKFKREKEKRNNQISKLYRT